MLEEEQERLDFLKERYALVFERIGEICTEERVPAPFLDYFQNVADFLLMAAKLREYPKTGRYQTTELLWQREEGRDQTMRPLWQKEDGRYQLGTVSGVQKVGQCQPGEVSTDVNALSGAHSLEQSEAWNARLYGDILPDNYERSYGNPTYAVRRLGDTYGRILSALYAMLREMIAYVREDCFEEQVILGELFVQIYTSFTCEELPTYRELQQIIYWFCSDYSELFVACGMRKAAARTMGFEKMGLWSILSWSAAGMTGAVNLEGAGDACAELNSVDANNVRAEINLEGSCDTGAEINPEGSCDTGRVINPRYVCDHSEDAAIILDKRFVERRLGALRAMYETYAHAEKYPETVTGGNTGEPVERKTVDAGVPGESGKRVDGITAEQSAGENGRNIAAGDGLCLTDVQPQPAAYRFSRGQRSLIDKAKAEIAQLAEPYQ